MEQTRAGATAQGLREIADYRPDMLVELAELWVASWKRTMPQIDFDARRAWFGSHLVGLLREGARVRVALTCADEIAGFVAIDPATAYLDQICVGPAWWGGGIAEALLDEARRLAPDHIVLDVNADNLRAVAFYRRHGFEEIGQGVNARSGLATLKLEWRAAAARTLRTAAR